VANLMAGFFSCTHVLIYFLISDDIVEIELNLTVLTYVNFRYNTSTLIASC
jgi:hypothetical protein